MHIYSTRPKCYCHDALTLNALQQKQYMEVIDIDDVIDPLPIFFSEARRDGLYTYQRPAAQQDHEDDEALKPVVLHDAVASLPQRPPHLPEPGVHTHLAAGELPNAACGEDRNTLYSPRGEGGAAHIVATNKGLAAIFILHVPPAVQHKITHILL